MERLPRVRALVVAVLEDQAADGRAADVIDLVVQRRHGHLVIVRHFTEGHGPPPGAAGGSRWPGGSGWPGGSITHLLADEDDVDAVGQLLVDLEDLPRVGVLP